MPLKFRVFSWIGAVLMGGLANINAVETAWAQIADDVVVMPRARTVRAIGDVFRDCPECPEVVILPPGSFLMGSVKNDQPWAERPAHLVTIGQPLAVGRYEVTFAEWDACVAEGGCNDYKPERWKVGARQSSGDQRGLARRAELRLVAQSKDGQTVSFVERSRVGVCGAGGNENIVLLGR